MAAALEAGPLHCACRDGDISIVKRTVPRSSIPELNRVESDGETCLHAASRAGHIEIIRLLLAYGASRRISNKDGYLPHEVAPTNDVAEVFDRLPEEAIQHYGNDDQQKQTEWLFGRDKAEAFSRAIHRGCIKKRDVRKTVEKIERAEIDKRKLMPDDDGSKEGKLLKYYLNEAREKNDPTFLLRMYTINGYFYNTFNRYMATGNSSKVYKKLCHGWSGHYIGVIMRHPDLKDYQYAGITYRGMLMKQQQLEQYRKDPVVANKAFQSTSKKPKVSLGFAQPTEPTSRLISVLIRYTILDKKSALSIRTLSEYPDEEEVLMLPGCLFRVISIQENVDSREINPDPSQIHFNVYQINLQQIVWTVE